MRKQNNNKKNVKPNGETIPRSPTTGVPSRMMVTLRYSDLITVNPSAAFGQYTFRGNSVFDPDYTSTGHQPRYFDQWSAFYQRYKVISSRIKVSVSNYSATSGVICVVVPHTDILTLTTYYGAAEQPLMKRTEQIPVSTRLGGRNTVLSKATTRQILGLSEAQLASEDYSAGVGANPLQLWYWNLGFFGATGNISVVIDVDLDYKVLFYDRADPGAS